MVSPEAGVPIIGTSPKQHRDRGRPQALRCDAGQARHPPDRRAARRRPKNEAVAAANKVGYPVLVRPSFVLGGRGMQLVHNETDLRKLRARGDSSEPRRDARHGGKSDSGRPFPRRRHRGGRRLHQRRRDGRDRRDHGAHRGGGHPQRRQRVRDPALLAERRR
ncbi:MAG: hypothetical protein QM796_04625 [Chthoniobacteraceae bacterium]